MSQAFAPKSEGELNCRRARQLKRQIAVEFPQLSVEVWAIAQGLAYIVVKGPTPRGLVDLCLHSEGEVAEFLALALARRNRTAELFAADKARNGDDSFDLPD